MSSTRNEITTPGSERDDPDSSNTTRVNLLTPVTPTSNHFRSPTHRIRSRLVRDRMKEDLARDHSMAGDRKVESMAELDRTAGWRAATNHPDLHHHPRSSTGHRAR